MIVDLNNLDHSLTMHTTGQSGHAYHPHYNDLPERWANGEYYPMPFSRKSVEEEATEILKLVP
jgi:penicillin amidase